MSRERSQPPMLRAISALTKFMAIVTGVLLLVIMVLTVTDVVQRLIMGHSLTGTLEWTEVILVAVAFGGLAHAEASNAHVRTDVAMALLPKRISFPLRVVGRLVALVAIGALAYLTLGLAVESYQNGEVRMGLAAVPVWPARAAIFVGFVTYFLQTLSEVITMLHPSYRLIDDEDDNKDQELETLTHEGMGL